MITDTTADTTADTVVESVDKYPEHTKLSKYQSDIQTIFEFLDHARREKEFELCVYRPYWDNGVAPYLDSKGNPTRHILHHKDDNPEYREVLSGFYPVSKDEISAAIYQSYGIDTVALEAERTQMLAEIRADLEQVILQDN